MNGIADRPFPVAAFVWGCRVWGCGGGVCDRVIVDTATRNFLNLRKSVNSRSTVMVSHSDSSGLSGDREAQRAAAIAAVARPDCSAAAFVADSATVCGAVHLGPGSSVWYGAVIRGDVERIEIGAHTNIQDGAVIHGDPGEPTIVGEFVTVGHRAIVHSAHIESGCTIGMGAIVLNGVRIGTGSLIGAGAVVTKDVPPRSLVVGIPGKVLRQLSDTEVAEQLTHAQKYENLALVHAGRGTDLGFRSTL